MIDTACRIASGLLTDDERISGALSTGEIHLDALLDIKSENRLSSELSNNDEQISGALSTEEIHLDASLDIGSSGRLPNYTGDYSVIPKVYEQTLETKNKSMTDDVTVEAVPYAEVSNPSGGLTANIAYIP